MYTITNEVEKKQIKKVKKMTYEQTCLEHIKDTLPEYIGQDVEICDLGMMLSEGENANGSWYCSTHKAEQDLDEFGRDSVAEFIEDYQSEFGDKPQYDAYCEPESFHCLMMIMGVEKLLNESDTIQEHWNENIELTQEMVDQIIEEIAQ